MLRPDTLDLCQRAKLSLGYLTNMVDPKLNYEPYWGVFFNDDPPHADHERWDSSELPGSWVDAIVLTRHMSGSKEGMEVEKALKELLLSYFDQDGLRYHAQHAWNSKVYSSMHELGFILNGLVTWYLETEDKKVRKTTDKLIKRLLEISIRKTAEMGMLIPGEEETGCCYFPHEVYTRQGWELTSNSIVLFNAAPLLALVRYYEQTNNQDALVLAEGLTNYLSSSDKRYSRCFDYDGRFMGHFHATMWAVAGILRYGMVSEKKQIVRWAKKVYDWALRQGSTSGWFPEVVGIRDPKEETCETCCITDMIHIGIMLAKAGYEEYWSNVERFTRNQLIENQVSDLNQIKVSHRERRDTEKIAYERIRERALGGFWADSSVSDRSPYNMFGGCCCAMGARALFLVWDSIIEKRPQGVYVNLALNRDSQWLEVVSYRPYQGKVKLIIRDAPTVFIRIPEWAGERIGLYVDNKPGVIQWTGNYLKLDELTKGQEVTVTYPLKKEQKMERIGGREYELSWRGDTVISISPKGKVYPLYQRDHLDTDKAPEKEKESLLTVSKIHW